MEKLRQLRKSINMNYTQFADLLGISKAYYWQIENNTRGLSYNMAIKIADIFKMKPDEVFYEDVKKKVE